jgi:type IV secretory pathway VirB4 component
VFGRCSLTVILHHEDRRALDHQAAQTMKVLAAHDGAFFDETYNLLNAWLSVVPVTDLGTSDGSPFSRRTRPI